MIISKTLLDSVSKQAKESPRLRMNYNLHEKLTDTTHRFFNAMEPGTVVPIHRHRYCAETFILVRGSMRVVLYDDDRNVIEDTILSAGGDNYGIHIPKAYGIGWRYLSRGPSPSRLRKGLTSR